jgi:UPF0755 protein
MKQEHKRGCSFLGLFFALGVLCILAVVASIVFLGLPETTAKIGPASTTLDPVERTTLLAYLLYHLSDLDAPVSQSNETIEFEVNQGDSAAVVVAQLEALGLVKDGTLLRNYLHYRGLDTSIEAGGYALKGDMTVREIAEALQKAEVQARSLTVVEGWRREQIAQALDQADLGIQYDEFIRASSDLPPEYASIITSSPSASLEGFLFPDTYSIDSDMTAEELVQSMLQNFDKRVTGELRSAFSDQGLSLYQAVILASIVEREAVVPDERELIASVFLNRLSMDMKLEADPTIQYALGQQPDGGWWKAPLSLEDLEINSPYNTYLYQGLPVGPICNPGLDSLLAVAYPASSPYLYFRAQCDGSGRHFFSETFEEHQRNACE